MYFSTKSYLKNNRYYTAKHTFKGEKTSHMLHEWHKCHLLAHVLAIVLKNIIYIYQNIKLFLNQLNNY
jgi:hypothetical protein